MHRSPDTLTNSRHARALNAHQPWTPANRRAVPHALTRPAIRLEAQANQANRAAPYSRAIFAALAEGKQPNVFVYAGPRAWERATARHRPALGLYATLLPKDVAPEDLRWPPAPTPLVIAEGVPRRDAVRLGAALIASGCVAALVVYEGELLTFRASRDVQGD